jgi:hypothetical protein
MSRIIILFVLVMSLLVTSCSSPLTPEPLKTSVPSPAAAGNEWMIKMTHSGGIMGLSRSIEISSDGKYTVTDTRANKTVTAELTANELAKLNKIVSESKFASTTKPQPSSCADCFVYSLDVQLNGKKFTCQADDITLSSSGLESLVTYLRDLMNSELK